MTFLANPVKEMHFITTTLTTNRTPSLDGLTVEYGVTAAKKLKEAPWKKSYDKPRQHINKQRHHLGDKGLYSQSYCFSSSHVWM